MKPSCRGGPWRRRWGNPSCSSPPTDLTIKLCDCHFVTIWLKWQSCQGHDDDDFDESHDDNQVDQNIDIQNMFLLTTFILIGHKADHCLPLSLTDSLTDHLATLMIWLWLRVILTTKLCPNQTYQTKLTKTSLPKQTFQTKLSTSNLLNQTFQTKPTKLNLPNQSYQTYRTKLQVELWIVDWDKTLMKAYILKELTLGSVVPFGNVCFDFHVHRRID